MKTLTSKFSEDMQVNDDNDKYFITDHNIDLIRSSARSGRITVLAQFCKFMMKIGATMILARLLTPQDFGILGMVMAVTAFVLVFKDMGLSMATVQRPEINHSQVSTLFWINLIFSIVLMSLTAILSPAIAWFYNDKRLMWVTVAIASTLIFGGLSVQHIALLKRQMRFASLAAVEILSLSFGIATAIISALYGFHYWALVFQEIAIAVTLFIGMWIICGWRPGLPVKGSGIKEMINFGTNLSGFNILNYFIRNLDKVLLGRWWGSIELGLYNKSYQLLLLPIQQIITPISSVVVPALSRLQSDRYNYRTYYCKVLNLIAFISIPVAITMVVLSDEIVLILLGDQWIGASPIFKILAIIGIWQPISGSTGWIFISLGKTDKMMRWALFSAPIYILFFFIGLPWGGVGIALSYLICDYLIRLPLLKLAFDNSPISMSDFIGSIWRPVLIGILMYLIMSSVRLFAAYDNPLLTLVYTCIAGYGIFIAIVLVWSQARVEAFRILRVIFNIKYTRT